jgi:hypothetical protein
VYRASAYPGIVAGLNAIEVAARGPHLGSENGEREECRIKEALVPLP